MKQLENVEEKERIAKELKELIEKINKIITTAPPFFTIRVYQNPGFNHGVNSFVNLSVNEIVDY